ASRRAGGSWKELFLPGRECAGLVLYLNHTNGAGTVIPRAVRPARPGLRTDGAQPVRTACTGRMLMDQKLDARTTWLPWLLAGLALVSGAVTVAIAGAAPYQHAILIGGALFLCLFLAAFWNAFLVIRRQFVEIICVADAFNEAHRSLTVEVAERRRAETELQQALSDLDQLYRLSTDMICTANEAGYFTRVNPAFERVLGYTTEELLRTPYMELIHPDDQEATAAE